MASVLKDDANMNILQINWDAASEAPAVLLQTYTRCWCHKAIQVRWLSGVSGQKTANRTFASAVLSAHICTLLGSRLFDGHGFGSGTATKALIAKIRELNPDLIHLHNLHGYYLHVGSAL